MSFATTRCDLANDVLEGMLGLRWRFAFTLRLLSTRTYSAGGLERPRPPDHSAVNEIIARDSGRSQAGALSALSAITAASAFRSLASTSSTSPRDARLWRGYVLQLVSPTLQPADLSPASLAFSLRPQLLQLCFWSGSRRLVRRMFGLGSLTDATVAIEGGRCCRDVDYPPQRGFDPGPFQQASAIGRLNTVTIAMAGAATTRCT